MRFRPRSILSAIGAIALAAGFSVCATTSAVADETIAGTVECDAIGYPVVGVWIDSSNNAHDGWASWTPLSGHPEKATYSKSDVSVTESYYVHVGCGGTTSSWTMTAYSSLVTGGQEFICHVTSSPAQRICMS